MKPIGILTFHRASNYGAVLQSYALQEAIRRNGGKVQIVNYLCPTVEDDHRPNGLFKHHDFTHALLHYPLKAKKDRVFNDFRTRKLMMSPEMKTENLPACKSDYSVFISGSDQVWNDRLSGFDSAYMLLFADKEQRYSYSCSFGFDSFPNGLEKAYANRLRDMKVVSVRESSALVMLGNAGIRAQLDVDPTLLLSDDQWADFCKKPNSNEPYILVYTVNGDVNLLRFARRLSDRTGIKILYINNQIRSNRDIQKINYTTPEEFVGWFANAEYVLTNSFHGTAFSLIFNKKLKVELETAKKYNIRSRDLLENCGLTSCVLMNTDADDSFAEEWTLANKKIGEMRDKSIRYIREIIKNASMTDGVG